MHRVADRDPLIRWRDAAAPIVLCIAILAIAGCGVIVERDGPGRTLSPNNIKDAVPRKEPRSKYGNPESYVVMGKRYYTLKTARGYSERGVASWYGKKFHGRKTSSGEIYDMYKMTAAHKGLPLPTYVQVRNLDNGRTAVVKVNDRGPFHDNRIIDLSYAAALKLDVADKGTAFVEVRALDDSGRPSGPVLTARPPSASVSSGIYLQIGAFQEHRNAVRLTDQVADVIPKNVHIREATKNGKSIYRVQVGPIVSVDIADGIVLLLGQLGITQHYFVTN